jgi:hypothetical protein
MVQNLRHKKSFLVELVSKKIFKNKLKKKINFSFAMLLGPLWGSGALPWLSVLFGIPLGLLMMSLVSNAVMQ